EMPAPAVYPADPLGTLHNPLLPVWWVLGWWRRFVPDHSLVHESVRERLQARSDYRPPNLLATKDVAYVA
ncbi:MAG TPA: hypothetical protein VLT83_09245, partial [Opitutaceae bacterium]|nr:hypothetical protein [Opitutaceae bacterium]